MTTVLEPVPMRIVRPIIEMPKPVTSPSLPRSAHFATIFLLMLENYVKQAQAEENNPEWLNNLYGLISGDWDTNLNRRHRRRSCECCLMVAARVSTYFLSGKLDELLDKRALRADDSEPRYQRTRKSRAN